MTDFGLKVRMFVVGSLLAALYLAVGIVGLEILGTDAWPIVLLLLLLFPLLQYKLGTWMATRRAEEMPGEGHYTDIHHMTEALSRDMGIKKPTLMIAEMGAPNAYATGRKGDGTVVVSKELIRVLERDELEGVIAHELAHIKNRDVLTMTVGSSLGMMVGYAVYLTYIFGDDNPGGFIVGYLLSIIAQMLVTVLVMAISRYREYVADDDARQYIGSGEPLARALEKISQSAESHESTVGEGTAALCIFNSKRGLLASLFATHPPTEKRIEKLRS